MKWLKNPLVWGPALLAVLALAWWLGSPLFLVSRVNEPPPVAMTDQMAATDDMAAPDDMAMSDDMAATDDMAMSDDMAATDDMAMTPGSGFVGLFQDGDARHHAAGEARVIEVAPGRLVLRFENFKVTNGPDLFVVLTRPGSSAADGVRLGALKGSEGNQNYEIPADVDVSQYNQVIIWCRAFDVTFGTAQLAQPSA